MLYITLLLTVGQLLYPKIINILKNMWIMYFEFTCG